MSPGPRTSKGVCSYYLLLLSGQGTVNVRAEGQLDVDLTGAGAVFYQGDPQLNVSVTGVGRVDVAN